MTRAISQQPNPKLDLVFERMVDLPPEPIWLAWTRPEQLMKWFTPAPWTTVECEIDLRPGGTFRTTMRSPEGQEFPNLGCYLEIIDNEKLVWTNALAPGFRPINQPAADSPECGMFFFTAVLALAPHGNGTKYTATVIHADEDGRNKHEAMGFQDGWGKALDQLVALVKSMHAEGGQP